MVDDMFCVYKRGLYFGEHNWQYSGIMRSEIPPLSNALRVIVLL